MVPAFCFWLSSRAEDALNIAKFGAAYEEYASKMPRWNVVKRLSDLKKRGAVTPYARALISSTRRTRVSSGICTAAVLVR